MCRQLAFFLAVLALVLESASADVLSDFIALGPSTPIVSNSGPLVAATTLNELTGGNEASEATLRRTFSNNATFGSFSIDIRVKAALTSSGPSPHLGVNFGTADFGLGVGTNNRVDPGERLNFELNGIDVSSLNPGYSVTGYGFESIRFAAANNALDSGAVIWENGATGGTLGNVSADPNVEVSFVDMNDGSGQEEAYIFEDGTNMFTWDFSKDGTNGQGAVTHDFGVWNTAASAWWNVNRVNLLADVSSVPEPSGALLALAGCLGYLICFVPRIRNRVAGRQQNSLSLQPNRIRKVASSRG